MEPLKRKCSYFSKELFELEKIITLEKSYFFLKKRFLKKFLYLRKEFCDLDKKTL